jgi:hypothetical protein
LYLTIHPSLAQVVVSSVETKILPSVESNLGNIIEAVGQATAIIVSVVTSTVVGLTVDEVETLLNDLTALKSIVQQIETTINSTIPAVLISTYPRSTPFPISLCAKLCRARAADDVLATNAALATEIADLYAVLSPLVGPILAYATSVVSIVKTGPVSEITIIVGEIKAIVGSLVAPIAATAAGVN